MRPLLSCRALGLLLLLAFGFRRAAAAEGRAVVVSLEAEFRDALADPSVAGILVNCTAGPFVLTPAYWARFPSPIIVNRSVTIAPTEDSPPFPVFDFAYLTGRAIIAGCSLLPSNGTAPAPNGPGTPAASPSPAASPAVPVTPPRHLGQQCMLGSLLEDRGVMVTVRGFELRGIQASASIGTFGFWASPDGCEVLVHGCINHLEVAMPSGWGTKFWEAAPRPGMYGAHGWPQLFSYLPTWCYPTNRSLCYSPANALYDVAVADPLTPASGGGGEGLAGVAKARGVATPNTPLGLFKSYTPGVGSSLFNPLLALMLAGGGGGAGAGAGGGGGAVGGGGGGVHTCIPGPHSQDMAGGYVLHYVHSVSHGDTNLEDACLLTMSLPGCVQRALARMHGLPVPDLDGDITGPGTNNGSAAPLKQLVTVRSGPNLALVLPLAVGVPVCESWEGRRGDGAVVLAVLLCRCLYLLRLLAADPATPALGDGHQQHEDTPHSSRRMRRMRSLLGSLATLLWRSSPDASVRAALLGSAAAPKGGGGAGGGGDGAGGVGRGGRGAGEESGGGGGFVSMMTGPGGIQIGWLLGSGSFGRVFEGVWRGRRVAVKVMATSSRQEENKVCDFGLSRNLDPGATHLRTAAAAGSVSHMAPECLMRGEMRREADVYAFGVLLWEVCTGARAYAGMSYGEVVQAVCLRGLRPPDCLAPSHAAPSIAAGPLPPPLAAVPEQLLELAAECWAAAPEERPAFDELVYRIDCLAMPVAAAFVQPPPPPPQQPARFAGGGQAPARPAPAVHIASLFASNAAAGGSGGSAATREGAEEAGRLGSSGPFAGVRVPGGTEGAAVEYVADALALARNGSGGGEVEAEVGGEASGGAGPVSEQQEQDWAGWSKGGISPRSSSAVCRAVAASAYGTPSAEAAAAAEAAAEEGGGGDMELPARMVMRGASPEKLAQRAGSRGGAESSKGSWRPGAAQRAAEYQRKRRSVRGYAFRERMGQEREDAHNAGQASPEI
ncbi:putative serine/threonine-protein kinase [Tetrabaena socialis]|uniref:Putative serine/threonine-protein kinase n=1 Tax=Tetrabaena socialis TaxID=47790 RepID=A0A2J8A1L0_9CHLO|nr:putative serine/threonine-protein kinase [Tetrabaena socialis]|eukprot:PNH06402.1 putative serine/threonine-protein kinase [Tetrabaena socialis]